MTNTNGLARVSACIAFAGVLPAKGTLSMRCRGGVLEGPSCGVADGDDDSPLTPSTLMEASSIPFVGDGGEVGCDASRPGDRGFSMSSSFVSGPTFRTCL